MSKIFDAYRKRVGEFPDLAVEIGKAGIVSLYPSPQGSQQDDFNRLANRILGLRFENRGTSLAFSSSVSKEGASFVSYNAAVFLATVFNQKVVWIDANYRSPQRKLLGLEVPTLSSFLQEPDRVHDLPAVENPVLIPGGADLQKNKGFFADSNYQDLLTNLTSRFDFVFLDIPPILDTTDAALMAAGTDGLLLVIEQKFLKREVIEHGVNGLKDKGVQVLGTVINRRTFELPKVIYERL